MERKDIIKSIIITSIITSILTTLILFSFIKDYFVQDKDYISDLQAEIDFKDIEINELKNSKYNNIEDTIENLEEQVSEIYEKIIPENERQQKPIHFLED